MASINKVILVGNLGSDPERRDFPGGSSSVTLSVATTEKRRHQGSREYQDFTEWHKVELRENLALIAMEYLRKGSSVYIEGSVRTRKWTDRNTGQERYATYIRANTMQMLGSPSSQRHQAQDDDNASYGDYTP
jgi:single-strand DNA-binding protein